MNQMLNMIAFSDENLVPNDLQYKIKKLSTIKVNNRLGKTKYL